MKKSALIICAMLLSIALYPATNATSSSKSSMTDATGGWWYALTTNYVRQDITIDYVAGSCTSITLTAGVRFTNEAGLISTTTYQVPVISSAGVATSDPITISAAGSYVFTVLVPQAADKLYIKVVFADGADATVNINHAADRAF